jgi:SAM-dependent methyltransferase
LEAKLGGSFREEGGKCFKKAGLMVLAQRFKLAYEPRLLPPRWMMLEEGVTAMEEWFRWAEEWSCLLRLHAGLGPHDNVLEIGCGLGRIAFPLRFILSNGGSYDGFGICKYKIDFLQKYFLPLYPNFKFIWANVHNTFYNPEGTVAPNDYRLPYDDHLFSIAYAASVFSYMAPTNTAQYFAETARVLKPGGRALFSCFLLDKYEPSRKRPLGFAKPDFAFDHQYEDYGDRFAISRPSKPEYMTAYRTDLMREFAEKAGLVLKERLPGRWSGCTENWIGAQDLLLLQKPG